MNQESTTPWDGLIAFANEAMEANKWGESEDLALAALKVADESFQLDDRRIGITLELLSEIYYGTREYYKGAPIMTRLLDMYIRCLGPDHVDTGTVTHNAAMLYHSWNKYDEAEPFYLEALRIKKNGLGKAHPQVVALFGHYIQMLRQTNRVKEAEEFEASW